MSASSPTSSGRLRRSRRLLVVALAALIATASAVALLAHRASEAIAATTVSCGQVITTSITVANDLNCSNQHGLVVGASGITINLNKHTFTGVNATGVLNSGGYDNVVITNGEIRGFAYGVLLDGDARANQIKTLNVHGNSSWGIRTDDVTGALITQNTVWGNQGQGIRVQITAANTTLSNNSVRSNGAQGLQLDGPGVTGTVVQGNKVVSNSGDGIAVSTAKGTQLTANVANGNGDDGIDSTGDGTAKLTSNTVNFNAGFGIRAHGATIDGGGNKATENGNARVCVNIVCIP